MTINRLSGLLLLAMLVFGQCSSDYDKGEQEFKVENYDAAKSHYKLVEKESDNYDKAQSRILEIDSIIEELLFNKAKILFSEKMYSDAEVLFFTINSASTLYADSKTFLTKIDSVRKARQLESKRLEKARKTEEDRIAKSKEIEDEKALRQVKQKVRALYNSLMAFKDKNDFHYYGFGVGYKYNKWLKDVQDLKNTPEANLLLGHGFGVGDLEMLGLEYMGSKGQETEYSRWSRKTISDGLRKTINKDRESTDADEEINTTTNNRGTEKRIHVDRFSGDTLDLSKDKFIMILADRFEDKNISYGISVWYDMNTCAWSPGILKIFVYTKDMKLLKTTTAKIQKELVESCQQLEELNLYMGNLIYQAAYINAEFTDDRGEIYYQKRKHLGDIQY